MARRRINKFRCESMEKLRKQGAYAWRRNGGAFIVIILMLLTSLSLTTARWHTSGRVPGEGTDDMGSAKYLLGGNHVSEYISRFGEALLRFVESQAPVANHDAAYITHNILDVVLKKCLMLLRLRNRGALTHGSQEHDSRWVLRLGFLFAGYEEDYVYWESAVLARTAVLSSAAVLLAHRGTTVQVIVAILILMICLWTQMKYEPLEHDWHDLIEERSLLASALILVFCLLANANSVESLDEWTSILLTLAVFIVTFVFFLTTIRLTLIGIHLEGGTSWIARTSSACVTRCEKCCRYRTYQKTLHIHLC